MAESPSGSLLLASPANDRAEIFLTQAPRAGNTNAVYGLARWYTFRG